MHVEPITFTRVFDVTNSSTRNVPIWTTFGFESEGKKIFGARVNGHPQIPEGKPLLVVLKRQDDWKTILGWAEVETGQLVIQDGRKDAIFYGLFVAACLAIVVPLFVLFWLEAHGLFAFFIGLLLVQFVVVQPVTSLLHRRNLVLAKQALVRALQPNSA